MSVCFILSKELMLAFFYLVVTVLGVREIELTIPEMKTRMWIIL